MEISKNIGDVKGRQYIGIVEVFRSFVVCLDANLLGLRNIKQQERGLLSKGCSSIHAENSDLTRVTARYCRVLSTPMLYLWNAWNCHKVIPLNHGVCHHIFPPYKELPHRPRRKSWSADGSRNGRNCGRSKNLGCTLDLPSCFFCAVSGCAAFCRKWRLGTVSLWLVVFRL